MSCPVKKDKPMSDIVILPESGIFTITTGLPGAPRLKVWLSAEPKQGYAVGHAVFTQAVHPDPSFQSALAGNVYAGGLGKAHQYYVLHGSALPQPLLGAPYITNLLIVLDGIWGTKGTACYSYWNDTPR